MGSRLAPPDRASGPAGSAARCALTDAEKADGAHHGKHAVGPLVLGGDVAEVERLFPIIKVQAEY